MVVGTPTVMVLHERKFPLTKNGRFSNYIWNSFQVCKSGSDLYHTIKRSGQVFGDNCWKNTRVISSTWGFEGKGDSIKMVLSKQIISIFSSLGDLFIFVAVLHIRFDTTQKWPHLPPFLCTRSTASSSVSLLPFISK